MQKLSKDADKLICAIYKHYLERRKYGASKADAKMLDNSQTIRENCLPQWSTEDVDDTCRELDRNGFLQCLYGDGMVYYATLTDDAIIYMENRFPDGLKQVIDYAEKIRAFLP